MKATGQRYKLDSKEQLGNFNQLIHQRLDDGKKTTVCFLEADRTSEQNSVLWGLISDIVKQGQNGETESSVRRYIKLRFGIPILRASDPAFQKKYDHTIKPYSFETKLELMDFIEVTSLLSREQFDRLLYDVVDHYENNGFHLAVER